MLLLSTIHDPAGKLALPTVVCLKFLADVYEGMVFCVTYNTHPDTIEALGIFAILSNAEGAANGRRCALEIGLKTESQVFHYCDGDRILFWALRYHDELRDSVKKWKNTDRLVVLGRTRQAFKTHPLFQRVTESIANLSSLSGVDYLSGSRIIPRDITIKILAQSKSDNAAAIDLEWPKIAGSFYYDQVDGLSYEHKLFGLEKPFKQEIKTRLSNMVHSIGTQWLTVK